jgi:hypothetical protein
MAIGIGDLKIIEYGGEAYCQAALLRYRLFYEEHGVPCKCLFSWTKFASSSNR